MKKKLSDFLIFIFLLLFAIIFVPCPVEKIFGIPCPGCMMTTAFYYLIQLDFQAAFYFNPVIYLLLIMVLPLAVSYRKNKKIFQKLLILTVTVWLGVYIYRMIHVFPNYPMPYVEKNLLSEIINILK